MSKRDGKFLNRREKRRNSAWPEGLVFPDEGKSPDAVGMEMGSPNRHSKGRGKKRVTNGVNPRSQP